MYYNLYRHIKVSALQETRSLLFTYHYIQILQTEVHFLFLSVVVQHSVIALCMEMLSDNKAIEDVYICNLYEISTQYPSKRKLRKEEFYEKGEK